MSYYITNFPTLMNLKLLKLTWKLTTRVGLLTFLQFFLQKALELLEKRILLHRLMMFQLIPGIATQVKAGKVNALAVMAPTRSPALPDVPTTTELGFPKLQSTTWFALLAPRGTPPEIIAKMNLEVNKILKDPAFTKRLADIGATPLGGSPKDLSDHLGSEIGKWGSLIKANGIKAQ
jgi:tripartite-type tricarboxylate transporter receptor subunit TctC